MAEFMNGTPQAQTLRKYFNIEKIKNVKLSKVMNVNYSLYLVVLDSRRPSFPISTASVIRAIPRDFLFSSGRSTPLSPFVDLDKFSGNIHTSMFMLIDLAGALRDRHMYTEDFIRESKVMEVTLLDLKHPESMSDFTKVFYDERRSLVGEGNKSVKLIDCVVKKVGTDDYVEWGFLTEATPLEDLKQETDPSAKFDLKKNSSKTYEIYIRIPNFFKWLDTRPSDSGIVTRDELKELISEVDAQMFCNCPAFHWQGTNYNLSQLDASIYPTNIPLTTGTKGKGWKGIQDHSLSCKHTQQLLRYITFFMQPMVSMLNKSLKDKKLIEEVQMEIEKKEIDESEVVQSGSLDQRMIKPLEKDKPAEKLGEGMVNIAVEIDKQFGLEDDPLSQYQMELKNAKRDADAMTLNQLKSALKMTENILVTRYVAGKKSLEETAITLEAIKLTEQQVVESPETIIGGRLFTELVYVGAMKPQKGLLEEVIKSVESVGIQDITSNKIIENLVERGIL